MSSEMRELIAKWRRIGYAKHEKARGPFVSESDKIANLAEGDLCHQFANELDALLARTEAGADGAVAWILRTGHGTALHEGPRPPVEGVDWKPMFDRPQDASGDATASVDHGSEDVPFIQVTTNTKPAKFYQELTTSSEVMPDGVYYLYGRSPPMYPVADDALVERVMNSYLPGFGRAQGVFGSYEGLDETTDWHRNFFRGVINASFRAAREAAAMQAKEAK